MHVGPLELGDMCQLYPLRLQALNSHSQCCTIYYPCHCLVPVVSVARVRSGSGGGGGGGDGGGGGGAVVA